MKYLIASALLLLSSTAYAACEDKVPYGIPEAPEKTTQLCRKSYVVKYYNACKVPLFVAQYLDPKQLGGNEPRDTFRVDTDLPPYFRAENGDYVGTGYDRGHLAPAADFQNDPVAMDESFLLSNAVPQTIRLNRGVWKSIEIRTRALAMKHDGVFVITGGIYSQNPVKIGDGVCVPTHTYKVIFEPKTKQSIGYVVPNVKTGLHKNIKHYQVPVTAIERKTGINFTPAMNDYPLMKRSIGPDLTTPR